MDKPLLGMWTDAEIEQEIENASEHIEHAMAGGLIDDDESVDTDWLIDNWLRSQLETGYITQPQFAKYHRMTHNEYVCRANEAHLKAETDKMIASIPDFLDVLSSVVSES